MKKLRAIFVGVALLLLATWLDHQLGRRKMRTALKLWLIAVLVVVVVRLLAGCAPPTRVGDSTSVKPAVRVIPYVAVIPLDEASANDGETDCDLFGYTYVKVKLSVMQDSLRGNLLLLHEGRHVQQIFHYGSCFEYMTRIKGDPVFRFQMEAEAYCAVWDKEKELGISHIWELAQIQAFLEHLTNVHDTKIPCGGTNDERANPP